jgi:membrane fusion protein, multidrug efflux system
MQSIRFLSPTLSLCIVLALLVGCKNEETLKALSQRVIDVEVAEALTVTGHEELAYSGSLEATETVGLSFAIAGRVTKVHVDVGDRVKAGQLLAEIESDSYRDAFVIAQAAEAQAEDAYQRLLKMHEKGNLPEIKLVEVQTVLHQARAAADIAKRALDHCQLRAPSNGVVGRRSVNPGMQAIPNITSISIITINPVVASFAVSEDEISSVFLAQNAQVTVSAIGKEIHEALVDRIGVLANPLTRSYTVKATIDNPLRQLLPGMLCQVTLERLLSEPCFRVPASAVMVDENNRNFIFKVQDNHALRVEVRTGQLLENGIEIIAGLKKTDLVVISGQYKLVHGSSIRIVKARDGVNYE